jgi:cyclomaltodextrinase / maltogenic alpha-amylase / neopullulanase
MNEFIFGSLATLEKRVAHLQEQARGVRVSQLAPPMPQPGESPLLTVAVGLAEAVTAVHCHLLLPEQTSISLEAGAVHWDLLNWRYYQLWQGRLPAYPVDTLVRYQIEARTAHSQHTIPATNGVYFSYLVGPAAPPAWAAEAIIYQLFPDRFYPGDGRRWLPAQSLNDIYGGTLQGVIDKLDYIADLGFNCLWLNPFFPDDTHHGYHATDYFQVNPRLGTLETVRELVQQAHQRGIRVLLDFVANHWGSRHATFTDAKKNPDSPYRSWYNWISYPDVYESYFGVQDLPQINTDDPAARAHMLEAARYWLTEFDFDGFRLDHALGPSLDFWTEFRAEVKKVRPDAWIFGEAVDTPARQLEYQGRLDGCLDFLLLQMLRDTFAFGSVKVTEFDAFLNQHESFFPADFSRPSFLDNHDMNRFIWLVKGDSRRLKLAALCQFTLAGPPIVYYGTEVGLSQERDIAWPDGRHIMEESRQPMIWDESQQDRDLHAYYRWLIGLRRQHPVLVNGRRQTLHANDERATYVYGRYNNRETILVAFNLSNSPQTITVPGHTFHLPALTGELIGNRP